MPAPVVFRVSIQLPYIRADPEAALFVRILPLQINQPLFQAMSQTPPRILAVDPTTKGLGYVIFELPFHLVEFKLANVSGNKNANAIKRFEKLLAHIGPDIVVFEDAEAPGSRRYPRVRDLIKDLVEVTREREIQVHTIARTSVMKCFSPKDGRATKHSIGERLTEYFPELGPKLQDRKLWESEAARMSIFDALALAVTYTMSS